MIDNFAVADNGNLCCFDKMKEIKIKIDGPQIVYRDDGKMCCSYDADKWVKIYNVF